MNKCIFSIKKSRHKIKKPFVTISNNKANNNNSYSNKKKLFLFRTLTVIIELRKNIRNKTINNDYYCIINKLDTKYLCSNISDKLNLLLNNLLHVCFSANIVNLEKEFEEICLSKNSSNYLLFKVLNNYNEIYHNDIKRGLINILKLKIPICVLCYKITESYIELIYHYNINHSLKNSLIYVNSSPIIFINPLSINHSKIISIDNALLTNNFTGKIYNIIENDKKLCLSKILNIIFYTNIYIFKKAII